MASDREGSAGFRADRFYSAAESCVNRPYQKEQFLDEFIELGSVSGAAAKVGVAHADVWAWRKRDSNFGKHFEEIVCLALEEKTLEGALGGSERLQVFLLKNLKPEVYDSRRPVRPEDLSDEQIRRQLRLPELAKDGG